MGLSELGEFGLISKIREISSAPEGVTGIGDDCAIIPQKSGLDTLVSTDMLIEGSHFLLSDASPYQVGWKSAAVNISDIAGMGGRPTSTFLALALPKNLPEEWMKEFMRGYSELSGRFNVPLLGGDTTLSPDRLCICVTVLGEIEHGKACKRSDARPGDLVCVTGPLGDSGAGLKVILAGGERDADETELVSRHYLPLPRVNEGLVLSSTDGVHAMMDISDGVGSDLRHIMEESGVGATVDVSKLPLSDEMRRVSAKRGCDPAELALCGGEDYELLFTVDAEAEKSLGVKHYVIGRITEESGLRWEGSKEDYMGFRHF